MASDFVEQSSDDIVTKAAGISWGGHAAARVKVWLQIA